MDVITLSDKRFQALCAKALVMFHLNASGSVSQLQPLLHVSFRSKILTPGYIQDSFYCDICFYFLVEFSEKWKWYYVQNGESKWHRIIYFNMTTKKKIKRHKIYMRKKFRILIWYRVRISTSDKRQPTFLSYYWMCVTSENF